VISCYGDKLRIEEENRLVFLNEIPSENSRFISYSAEKYEYPNSNLVFLIYSGSAEVFLAARKTLIDRYGHCTISFILLDKEMEKTLFGRPIPAYFEADEKKDTLIVKYKKELDYEKATINE
jgi:hypothetical protein